MSSDNGDGNIVVVDLENKMNIIREIWLALASQNTLSYFLTWGWIQAWLQELPSDCNVLFVYKRQSGKAVLAFFVGIKNFRRSKFFKIRQLCLNASGKSEYDNIWIEYNGILCAPDTKFDLASILKELPFKWEELYLPGVDLSSFPGNALSSLPMPFRYVEDDVTVSPYVDLKKVRQVDGDYLSLLSSNTRAKIRRSLKIIEKFGPIELVVPSNREQAFQIYQELIDLHQATWISRGEKGVFSSPLFCKFHERLINNQFDKGEIQLMKIHTGDKTIGCLYNFIWHGRIYFYQCGFNYEFGKKVQPGLVSHFMAVQYNAVKGNDIYDFLAGDARYKRSLATDSNKMVWGRIQRANLKLHTEQVLHNIKNRIDKG